MVSRSPLFSTTISPKVSGIDLVGIHLHDTTRTTEVNEGHEKGPGHESDMWHVVLTWKGGMIAEENV